MRTTARSASGRSAERAPPRLSPPESRPSSPQGRPSLDARGLQGVLIGSAQRADLDPTASGAGVVDLRTAVQLEVYAQPSLISFGTAGADGAEQVLTITNISTRRVSVSVGSVAIAPKGVEISFDPGRVRIRAGQSASVVVRANTTDLSSEPGAATGELVLRTGDSPEVHVPWAVSVPGAGRSRLEARHRDDRHARVRRHARRPLVRRGLRHGDARSAGARRRAHRGRALARRRTPRTPRATA